MVKLECIKKRTTNVNVKVMLYSRLKCTQNRALQSSSFNTKLIF